MTHGGSRADLDREHVAVLALRAQHERPGPERPRGGLRRARQARSGRERGHAATLWGQSLFRLPLARIAAAAAHLEGCPQGWRMVRVACHQLAPVVGDLDGNRARALAALDAAAAAGARIVVLPELAASGYVFRDAAEARALAEPPDGPTVSGWAERAAAHDLVVVGGFAEAGADGRAVQQRRGRRRERACAPSTARSTCGTASRESFTPGDGAAGRARHAARPDRGDGLLRPRVPGVGARRGARAAPSCCACRRTGRASRGPPASARWRCCARWSRPRRTAWRSRCATAAGPSAASSGSPARRSPGPTAGCSPGRPRRPSRALLLADVDLAAARDKALGPAQRRAAGSPPGPLRAVRRAPHDPVVTAARTPGMRVTITGATGRVGSGSWPP